MEKPKKPQIFDSEDQSPNASRIVNAYDGSIKELFFIENPHLKKEMPQAKEHLEAFVASEGNGLKPLWIYYPWRDTLVKSVDEETYFRIRTARNRNIIRDDEQKKYRDLKIGIAGLSVGSATLSNLVQNGGPKYLRIADFDALEVTNLNRIKATLLDVGTNKAWIAAMNVWELDPFAEIDLWDAGVNKDNLEDFITKTPKLDIVVDAMDSLDLKIMTRLICKQHKIPVIMGTDIEDGFILDVERYDLEPDRPILHGLVGDMKMEDLQNLDFKEWMKLATKIVGPDYLPARMRESLLNMGKTVTAVPQMGPSSQITGAAACYAIRKLAAGENMPSGRYNFDLQEKLVPGYMEPDQIEIRQKQTEEFKAEFAKK